MPSADFAGRLRSHRDSKVVSQIPKHQPLGCLLLHSLVESGFGVTTSEINTGRHDGIIDHVWTDNGTLVVLTKENPSQRRGVFSSLRLIQKDKNETTWLQVKIVEYRHLASHVLAYKRIIVVAYSSGVRVYVLSNIISKEMILSEPIELIQCNSIHAICVAQNFLSVVSGIHFGVWNLDQVESNLPKAIWSTTLSIGLERVTCLVMSKSCSAIVLACWDGSLLVFRRRSLQSTDWIVDNSCEHRNPWKLYMESKEVRYPVYVALEEFSERGQTSTLIAVSALGSTTIRFFNLDLHSELSTEDRKVHVSCPTNTDIIIPAKKAVNGMLSTTLTIDNIDNRPPIILWIDDADVLHQDDWPHGLQN